ncbi:hemerythrin domain-containing protein [bacterium]|nr:hemerythrin domain-containing protein [bacterium]
MKRIPELRDLSDDHHRGLVLARKAKLASKSKDESLIANVWKEIKEKFISELEPHFQIEEKFIAPNLAALGKVILLERFYTDHKILRKLIKSGSKKTSVELHFVGVLLEKHIRFEERELFEEAQNYLSTDLLNSIAKASKEMNYNY